VGRRVLERKLGYPLGLLPSQKLFHDSKARFKGFSGPVGSGKTRALCAEVVRLCYRNAGRVGLVGAPTYPMLRDATVASLVEYLGELGIGYELNRSDNYLEIPECGSKVLFRAVEEFDRLRGSNLAWFGVDELTYTQEDAWLRLEGRLRDPKATELCGFGVWTPKGYDWVYERFILEPVEGYETIKARPFENRFLLTQIPDYYERLKHSYDQRFYEQEVMGSYVHMHTGRVYTSFDRHQNVSPAKVDDRYPLLWALDFNVDPMSAVVAQRIDDQVHVLDEIVLHRATTEQACEEFQSRYANHAAGLLVYADATGARMQTTGRSDIGMLTDRVGRGAYGAVTFKVPRSNPPVAERVALVNSMLGSASGVRRLRVDGRCRELIKDFEMVSYKEGTKVVDKERDTSRTHLSDALGYLIWQEFGLAGRAGERGQKLI
jgi:hypothetical protein